MKFRGLFAAFAVAVAVPSFAGYQQVFSDHHLNHDDFIDWSQFGVPYTPVPNFSLGLTNLGNQFQVSSDGSMDVVQQSGGNGWNGNFNPGDNVLYNQPDSNFLALTFNDGIAGIGFQVEADAFGPFTAELDVFDLGLNPVATYFISGDSEFTSDGSAPFLGVLSENADIGGIIVSLSANNGLTSLGVGDMTISNTPVPEPATMAVLGAGALALLRRRKSR